MTVLCRRGLLCAALRLFGAVGFATVTKVECEPITFADHCYSCTAGARSSDGGALT